MKSKYNNEKGKEDLKYVFYLDITAQSTVVNCSKIKKLAIVSCEQVQAHTSSYVYNAKYTNDSNIVMISSLLSRPFIGEPFRVTIAVVMSAFENLTPEPCQKRRILSRRKHFRQIIRALTKIIIVRW